MSPEQQIKFLNGPRNEKYKQWAIGTDWAYRLMECDFILDIEELTCYHLRIKYVNIKGKQTHFDFFPMGKKLQNLSTKRWHNISSSEQLKITVQQQTY